jgi:hypothetical protein
MRRPIVEGRTSIDVRAWAREGLLSPGRSFRWRWSHCGASAESIEVLPVRDAVILLFRWRAPNAEIWQPFAQHVPLASTACHFGGSRAWFRCAVDIGDGQCCGRRVALLYLRGHVFGCRKCCGLAYASQSESPRFRAITKAQKRRIRLGGGPNLLAPFPLKPARMHARTYHRLLGQAMTAQEYWIALSLDHLHQARCEALDGRRRRSGAG